MTTPELNAPLGGAGCTTADEVLVAVLEISGQITGVPRHKTAG